jgi:hypothetical protein
MTFLDVSRRFDPSTRTQKGVVGLRLTNTAPARPGVDYCVFPCKSGCPEYWEHFCTLVWASVRKCHPKGRRAT